MRNEIKTGDRVYVDGVGFRHVVRVFTDADGNRRALVQCQTNSQDDFPVSCMEKSNRYD